MGFGIYIFGILQPLFDQLAGHFHQFVPALFGQFFIRRRFHQGVVYGDHRHEVFLHGFFPLGGIHAVILRPGLI